MNVNLDTFDFIVQGIIFLLLPDKDAGEALSIVRDNSGDWWGGNTTALSFPGGASSPVFLCWGFTFGPITSLLFGFFMALIWVFGIVAEIDHWFFQMHFLLRTTVLFILCYRPCNR